MVIHQINLKFLSKRKWKFNSDENTNNHLVEKIAIPVGTVSGVSIASFLTYCFCKKKKRRKQDLSNNQITLNDNNLESEEIHSPSPVVNNNFLTPLESPNSLFDKEQLIKQLELELVGKEQLWNNYLELNNLLLNHSQSQFIYQNFSQLQNELLKTFTMDDLNLLLENENNKQARNSHTEYFEIKEEAWNPQEINSLTPITDINYHKSTKWILWSQRSTRNSKL